MKQLSETTTATDQSFTLSLPSAEVEISYKGHEVVQKKSPWSKTNEDIFKYKVYAVLVGKGKVVFDFHGSIADCNSDARILLGRFKGMSDREHNMIDRFFRFNQFPDLNYFITISGVVKENKESTRSLLQLYLDSRIKFYRLTGETMYGAETLDRIRAGEFDSFAQSKYQTGEDLAYMFRCFVDDALYGEMELDDFASELGYNTGETPLSKTISIHKACQQALAQFQELGVDADALRGILNEMSEAGIE